MEKIIRSKREADKLLEQGWTIKHVNTQSQGYSAGKTCCLGCLFLPLALLGRKKDKVEYIMERLDEENSSKE